MSAKDLYNKIINNIVPGSIMSKSIFNKTLTDLQNEIEAAQQHIGNHISKNTYSGNITMPSYAPGSAYTVSTNPSTYVSSTYSNSIIGGHSLKTNLTMGNGESIVTLNADGTVTWNEGMKIDEAAEAFAKSLQIGAEMAAGIKESTKQRVRDSVLEDLIDMSKDKGQLTTEELEYILSSFKMVDKLKGIK